MIFVDIVSNTEPTATIINFEFLSLSSPIVSWSEYGDGVSGYVWVQKHIILLTNSNLVINPVKLPIYQQQPPTLRQ